MCGWWYSNGTRCKMTKTTIEPTRAAAMEAVLSDGWSLVNMIGLSVALCPEHAPQYAALQADLAADDRLGRAAPDVLDAQPRVLLAEVEGLRVSRRGVPTDHGERDRGGEQHRQRDGPARQQASEGWKGRGH